LLKFGKSKGVAQPYTEIISSPQRDNYGTGKYEAFSSSTAKGTSILDWKDLATLSE
jgi:hypothetical protein